MNPLEHRFYHNDPTTRVIEIDHWKKLESKQRAEKRGLSGIGYKDLGELFQRARVDQNLTVEELSDLAKLPSEDIIDLELASFYLPEASEIATKLLDVLKIDKETFDKTLLSSTIRK